MESSARTATTPSITRILVVDDDTSFLRACERGFAGRDVRTASTYADGCEAVTRAHPPDLAIIDLRLGTDSGLGLVALLRRRPEARATVTIVLSGYLSVAVATHALELGADKALFKPVTCGEVAAAAARVKLGAAPPVAPEPVAPASLARAEWEHITRALTDCDGNVSAAARSLGIHRQSLQRKLRKHAPRR